MDDRFDTTIAKPMVRWAARQASVREGLLGPG